MLNATGKTYGTEELCIKCRCVYIKNKTDIYAHPTHTHDPVFFTVCIKGHKASTRGGGRVDIYLRPRLAQNDALGDDIL